MTTSSARRPVRELDMHAISVELDRPRLVATADARVRTSRSSARILAISEEAEPQKLGLCRLWCRLCFVQILCLARSG